MNPTSKVDPAGLWLCLNLLLHELPLEVRCVGAQALTVMAVLPAPAIHVGAVAFAAVARPHRP